MSGGAEAGGPHVPCLEEGCGVGLGGGGRPLYSEVQCIIGNGPRWTDRLTDTIENITISQLHWRVVIRMNALITVRK